MDDYIIIAVDSESKVAIRFGCLTQLIDSALTTHNPSHSCLREALIQLVTSSVLLGSRQDEQQTLLFKLSFENSPIRMNCEVSSLGASRVAVYPERQENLLDNLVVKQLSVTTLTRKNDVYESHLMGRTVPAAFEQYLVQSQQAQSIFLWPSLDALSSSKKVLWVEKLPGTTSGIWETFVQHLSGAVWEAVQSEADPDRSMNALFPDGFRILAITKPKLTCTCSFERVLSSLTLLSEADLAEIFMDGRGIHTRCDYCHKDWQVSDAEIRDLLKMPKQLQ